MRWSLLTISTLAHNPPGRGPRGARDNYENAVKVLSATRLMRSSDALV
jgi:hypothetical protein